ncbi:unnamed protein product [Kluyveromyces dobzhanskii CBS 2104]|uniref:Chromosome segregation in meiosis protein n=1 Tax=Kluyveromyces dobzhanskii CBS 2104 TaxID=1427455 RepID=A0A0A8LDW9_9SACH|nr:unnamed protein product [Kluyveromyces dobzhanskii CBS 2104]
MSDPLAYQGNSIEDGNMTLDFELDPTVSGLDPTMAGESEVGDPTVLSATTRKPRIKLTAEKLLSKKGLPYLVKHAPRSCRVNKKKSAYDNLTNILQFYQLWAHDLYPRAKFKDFISLCESLGKNDKELREYRINLVRKDMGVLLGDDFAGASDAPDQGSDVRSGSLPLSGLFATEDDSSAGIVSQGRENNIDDDDEDDDDEVLYSSHRQRRTTEASPSRGEYTQQHDSSQLPDDEELLGLSAAAASTNSPSKQNDSLSEDEMAMMREMDNV